MEDPGRRISFFDAIDANKRNSVILIILISLIYAGAIFAFSYLIGMDPIITSILGFFILIFYAFISFYAGDRVILALAGAKEVQKKEYPFLYNVVEGLALASQIPMPKVYVVEDPAPNAFATGRDPAHASVAVTTGLLEMMSREELEGVIAHEISHIGNFDIRFMMVAIVFIGAIGLLANIGSRMFLWGGGRGRGRGGSILSVVALLFLVLAPIFAFIVHMAISRQREYLADATAAKLTRYPEGLASALEKISKAGMNTKNANDTTASLYIANPFPRKAFSLGATHPAIDKRVSRLRSM
ncbi:MAG: M48 family metallopeptidase [Candidatus Micrarchaeota archaeon]